MKTRFALWAMVLLVFANVSAPAATLYVDLNSTNPVPPYADWSTAASNIQDAVDAANPGDLVLATNGVYQAGGNGGNRVALTKAITLKSVNGPAVTTISGLGSVRCLYVTNGAAANGFALIFGNSGLFGAGGGVLCESSSATLSNCIVGWNTNDNSGGGIYQGTLTSCVVVSNSAAYGGGAYASILNNCLIVGNTSVYNGGGVSFCTLNNCTLAGNVSSAGGGMYDSGGYNSVVYYNSASSESNYSFDSESGGVALYNCCTSPDPGNLNGSVGNITNQPIFVNMANGNFRLQTNSPCINSGNNAYVTGDTDLDGRPRIVGGSVDMGAYEFQGPGTGEFIGWLQQYGLPTDGSADYADSDHDGLNNYQEWIDGTNPTNALSVLAMLPPVPANSPAGLLVSWESVSNRTYFLQQSTNLGAQLAFSTIQSNIVGQAGITDYTDTNAVGNGPFFYRVGVQQ